MATVSVIMPSYNYERYISEAIESILAQTFSDLELIIIDDCSTDGSQDVIKQYMEKDARIKARFHDRNMGIAFSENEALDMANGDYIAFISSDDNWLPNKLERQMEVMLHEGDVVVYTEALIIDGDGHQTGLTCTEYCSAVDKAKSGALFKELMYGNYPNWNSLLVRREHFESTRLDESAPNASDYIMTVELSTRCPFVFIEEPLLQYRVHSRNTSRTNRLIMGREDVYVSRLFLSKYRYRLNRWAKAGIYTGMSRGHYRMNKLPLAFVYYLRALAYRPYIIVPHMKYWLSAWLGHCPRARAFL
ncbi:MAG: glycosyltransferase [Actinomycetia bacterium]|nr:glycosyltransferase [Actinomycetes bacterium]